MSSKRSDEASQNAVKRIGRVFTLAATGIALFFRALSRGKKREPAARRTSAVATSPPAATVPAQHATPAPTPPAHDVPAGVHMPQPTIWPLVLSLGITLVALGILTNLVMTALGILCMIWAIAGWVGDLRHG